MKKTLLFLSLSLVLACKSRMVAPSQGLIAYFPFSNSVTDAGPNSLKIVPNGGTSTEDRKGNKLSALYFNGTSDYLAVTHDSLLDLGVDGDISISLWFKADENQEGRLAHSLLHKGFGESLYQDYHLFFNVNKKMAWSTGNSSDECAQTVIDDPVRGAWHHLVVTLSAETKTKKIYIDNKLINQCTYTIKSTSNTQPLLIGTGFASGTGMLYFKGAMDEIRLYDRALSEKEIRRLYRL